MNNQLKLFDVKWVSHTGGPSPYDNNARTELFLMGCKKARLGIPCKGCFNQELWADIADARLLNPESMANHIAKFAPNKFITIVGGEPLDQIGGLADLCFFLKQKGFHVLVFTHFVLNDILLNAGIFEEPNAYTKFLKNIDVLVDGEYDEAERIYDEEKPDGLHNAVGSGNQIIWDFHEYNKGNRDTVEGIPARHLLSLAVTKDGELHYLLKDEDYVTLEANMTMEKSACVTDSAV